MRRSVLITASMLVFLLMPTGMVSATPSNQIWIPSTDLQPFMVGHIGIDNYLRTARNSSGGRDPNLLDIGFTLGLLPFARLQMEAGVDYLTIASNPNDQHPWSGNAKIGTPEDSLFSYSPALAAGIYNAWPGGVKTEDSPLVRSGQNIAYGLIAKTIPFLGPVASLGRVSAGYYHGSKKALGPADEGVLLSWDRTMKEISDRLWLAADYMGGKNVNGALSVGAAWRFAGNVSLLFGYDLYHRSSLSGKDTFTVQLDIDFP